MAQSLIPVVGLIAYWACTSTIPPAAVHQPPPGDAPQPTSGSSVQHTTEPPPPIERVDRTGLTDVGMAGPIDYANPGMWACRPGAEPNECHRNLDATEVRKDGTRVVVSHEPAAEPAFDCFYVFPTVKLQGDGNLTDFSETGVELVRDPLLSQAARFSRLCNVYAPLYRQVGLDTSVRPVRPAKGTDREVALSDVRAAFRYYLDHLSKGRKFVLIGHSQGTGMLSAMMQQDVDPVPELRDRMISALLLGGWVSVAQGQRVGGTFKNIPTCSRPGEAGCVVAYVSFAKEAPPPPELPMFGVAKEPGTEIACTEPAALAGNAGRYRGSYFSLALKNPLYAPDQPLPDGLTTPFALYRDTFRGACVKNNGRSYLEISVDQDPDDQRGTPPHRIKRLEAAGFGLHLVDFNLPFEDLMTVVELQAATALGR